MATRAFPAGVDRIVRRTTIVYSADDIRRNITLRLVDGAPCDLELGCDITTTRGFIVPGELAAFSLDFGNFRLFTSGALPFVFSLLGFLLPDGGCPVEMRNVNIVTKVGSVVDTVWVVDQAFSVFTLQTLTLSLSRVIVDGTNGTITNVFAMGQTTVGRVVADSLTLLKVGNMFAAGSNLTAWTWCRFTDVIATGIGLNPVTIGQGAASPSFVECVFMRMAGFLEVDTGAFSQGNFWAVVTGNGGAGFTTNSGAGLPQTLLRVSGFTPRTLSVDDIDLDTPGGGGGGITLTAATITVPFGAQEQTATVVDAGATVASKVLVAWGNTLATDENQPAASNVTFSAVAAAGSIDVTVSSDDAGNVGGTYKILYSLG
jgi:hypothetical protein